MPSTSASSEYGTLLAVAMRYAQEFDREFDGPDVHPVLARQKATSRWEPHDPATARAQQDALIKILTDRGVTVILLGAVPGCSTQHYPRDLGFVIDELFFTARLNSDHRLPELDALAHLPGVLTPDSRLDAGTIEGGDVMLHIDTVLVGLSEETSPEGVAALRRALERTGVERDVVPVAFNTDGIVHLDDHFNIIAPNLALVHRSVFPKTQLSYFEQHFDMIEVTDDEALAVQTNVLAIAPDTVVVAAGSTRIAMQLRRRGIAVIEVDYSEITRLPGSLRCSTLPLRRA